MTGDRIPPQLSGSWQRKHGLCSVENLLHLYPSHIRDLDLRDLKRSKLAIPFTALYLIFFLVMFGLTFSFNLTSAVGKEFLSLQGSNEYQNCELEPAPVTATFEADYEGRWSTQKGFTANNTIYSLSFFGSLISVDEYRQTMLSFGEKLKVIGAKSARRDFIWSILAWVSFRARDQATGLSFLPTAQVDIVLNEATIKDNNVAKCTLTPDVSFSADSRKLEIGYQINWPPAQSVLRSGASALSDAEVARRMIFVKRPLAQSSCAEVCSALPKSSGGVPFTCRSGIKVDVNALNLTEVKTLRESCGKQRALTYIPSSSTGPLIYDGASMCHAPNSGLLSCDASNTTLPTNFVKNYAAVHGGLFSSANLYQVCPCSPAYTEPCPDFFSIAQDFLYNPSQAESPSNFPIRFDTRSIFLATAVNFGIIKLSDLSRVTYPRIDAFYKSWTHQSNIPSIQYYIDLSQTPMSPIVCLDKTWMNAVLTSTGAGSLANISSVHDPKFCFVIEEGQGGQKRVPIAFPVLSNTAQIYEACKCAKGGGDLYKCNEMNFDIDLLMFRNVSDYSRAILSGILLSTIVANDPVDGDLKLTDIFNAAKAGGSGAISPLCPHGGCFLLSYRVSKIETVRFLAFNKFGFDLSFLSREFYHLGEGVAGPGYSAVDMPCITCTDTVYQPTALANMAIEPPTNLTFNYFRCRTTTKSALISSFGSAAGSTGLLASFMFASVTFVFLLLVNKAPQMFCLESLVVDGRVVATTDQRTHDRLAKVEELLATMLEAAATDPKAAHLQSPAYQQLCMENKRHSAELRAKARGVSPALTAQEDRPSSFDIASAYGDAPRTVTATLSPFSVTGGGGGRLTQHHGTES